jgi:Tfp pilus assembly protein PilO
VTVYSNTNNRLWVIGSVLLIAAIVAMGWFLGVSPKLAEAGAADQQRVAAEAQNVEHEKEVAVIKKQYEQLPELKEQLAVLRSAVPGDDELSTFLGELHQLEQSNGVALLSFTASDAQPYTPVKKPVTTVSTTNPLVTADNFVAIPVKLEVAGDPAKIMDFIEGVQTGERLFLVTELSLKQDEIKVTYQSTITGFVYVLLDNPPVKPKTVNAAEAPKG